MLRICEACGETFEGRKYDLVCVDCVTPLDSRYTVHRLVRNFVGSAQTRDDVEKRRMFRMEQDRHGRKDRTKHQRGGSRGGVR